MMEHGPIKRPHFFFTTAPTPCPYLEGRVERKVVTELIGQDSSALHDSLSRAGFRRSHTIAYVPACKGCSACIPVRIVVDDFVLKKSFKRIMSKCETLVESRVKNIATNEQYELFAAYQATRHADGDMARMDFIDYRSMVEDSPIDTYILEYRTTKGELVAVCLTDQMSDGLSAVYSFFKPELVDMSFGTYMVLRLIERARAESLPYVYLGYWIENSNKMSYKSRFQPLEAFQADGWGPLAL